MSVRNSILRSLALVLFMSSTTIAVSAEFKKPKLLVVISIDQFRADYLTRFRSRFLPAKQTNGQLGGFTYLTTNGAYVPWASHSVLQNMTGPGHAAILTGSYPYQNKLPLNDWYNGSERVYCVEDSRVATVGAKALDPHAGTSPRNLVGTTVGDELKNAGYASKIVSIAIKDRAAILLGGHRADLALWLDSATFRWVSSEYYLPGKALPQWVQNENARLEKQKGQEISWNVPTTRPSGLTSNGIPPPSVDSKNFGILGAKCPHKAPFGSPPSLALPAGLTITEVLAEQAVSAMNLGSSDATDVLAISFSSFDYAGHIFGPNSREMEEMAVEMDQTLANLLNFLNKKVPGGMSNVVVTLTADHGVATNQDYLTAAGVDAGRIDEKKLDEEIEAALSSTYGPQKSGWLVGHNDLNFYLNRPLFSTKNIPLENAETLVKGLLASKNFTSHVITRHEIATGAIPGGVVGEQIRRTYVDGRSGDVILIPKPSYVGKGNILDHQTGYNYDRRVPIIFAGAGFKPGTYYQETAVVDIAPTLSAYLGILPPAASEGRILHELYRAN